ncbi:holo-ACP synthase [Exilibacterium tricleocarpae]|uniref:Holo-[acyl-carrier-protein] synthase n=1 Tax=Exilibacterium tricleocarpae TaxID=2591008 RepID=A0A545U3K0_9GAMM|nr:holo-ACP synthase [Exilibacterium tricleocarpae]TQV84055.1 holo-ACP synthase [Exilibacterium tricleocarpae]
MVVGIGTDIVQIDRIGESLARLGEKFAARILTPAELQEYRATALQEAFLAKRFAAKEAVGKALGTGIGQGVSWQHMEVRHTEWGAPELVLTGNAKDRMVALGGSNCLLSLSDEQDYAVAFVVING